LKYISPFYLNERMVALKLILLISETNCIGQEIKAYLPQDFVLLEGSADDKGTQLLKNIAAGIVLVDTSAAGALPWLERAYPFRPDLTYIGITENGKNRAINNAYSLFYDTIAPPFSATQVQNMLQRSWERTIFLMQKQAGLSLNAIRKGPAHGTGSAYSHKEHTLCKFSRALGTDFNRRRLIDLFISTLEELAPVGKISLLLPCGKEGVYCIAAQRGLDPELAAKLRFHTGSGLIARLSREGRILYVDDHPASPDLFMDETIQEMRMLHSLVSIPLMARGRLVGALNLGAKITGYPYGDDELEIFYILAGNVATALLDIELHHQLRYQKLYIESILLNMNSGVIAIDMDDRITAFNRQAAEILKMDAGEVIAKDLRCLPSPLGDILFHTRASGQGRNREELELARERLPLEISAYQLVGEDENMLGSVMIFDNIAGRRQLEKERRKADQLEVLNHFVGQLAHEIKNPMVAILTFAEMLPERYGDGSFRESFAHTVQKEVKRLNELVEQLIDFATPLSYKYSAADIHEIVEQGLILIQEQNGTAEAAVEFFRHEQTLMVRADRALLSRAFAYLAYRFLHNLTKESSLSIKVAPCSSFFAEGGVRLSFWSTAAKLQKEDMDKIFNPLCLQRDQRISLGLPVSRKIVEDHGGKMHASLSQGGYLNIDVELPIYNGKGR